MMILAFFLLAIGIGFTKYPRYLRQDEPINCHILTRSLPLTK